MYNSSICFSNSSTNINTITRRSTINTTNIFSSINRFYTNTKQRNKNNTNIPIIRSNRNTSICKWEMWNSNTIWFNRWIPTRIYTISIFLWKSKKSKNNIKKNRIKCNSISNMSYTRNNTI